MTDEQDSFAESEQDIPAIGEGEDTTNTVAEDDTGGEDQDQPTNDNDDTEGDEPGDDQATPEDYEVIEFEGEQYQVPAALKGGFMMQADYTRKTQETAERARQLESREAEINQRAEATEEELNDRAALQTVKNELKRFEQYDWAAYQQHKQAGTPGADEAWNYIQHLKAQKGELEKSVSERQEKRSQEAQQSFAKRLEETQQFAKEQIKGWSPEVDQKLLAFAQEQQIPDSFLRENMSPVLYKILHRAWLGEQSLAKQTAAVKPQPKPDPKPTKRISPRTNPGSRKPVSEWTVDDHARAEQERARRRS